jgi:hypothetical protein
MQTTPMVDLTYHKDHRRRNGTNPKRWSRTVFFSLFDVRKPSSVRSFDQEEDEKLQMQEAGQKSKDSYRGFDSAKICSLWAKAWAAQAIYCPLTTMAL